MTEKYNGFFAYPSNPKQIGKTIGAALEKSSYFNNVQILSWEQMDVAGQFISESVLTDISKSDILIADISVLNFNVTYEIGFAIGSNKKLILVKDDSIEEGFPGIENVGIFDTLGFEKYQNSNELLDIIKSFNGVDAIKTQQKINTKAPMYLLDTKYKTDWATRVVSRIKKAGLLFRTFDSNESSRLPAQEAIDNVSQSLGVIVSLLGERIRDYKEHNMRAAFIAGLAEGMGKPHIILQDGESPVPLDYRDLVKITKHPKDIDEAIADLAGVVTESMQLSCGKSVVCSLSFLQELDLGATSAENEMRDLESYYLKTDSYLKAKRGENHLIVGRKGSGKSAVFYQLRDHERSDKKNIVLDLKPEGYKLIKFKESILKFLKEGTFQHVITVFWEYVLFLELCYKVLEKDKDLHIRDHNLYEPYLKLASSYRIDDYSIEGDFSERLSSLMENISSSYASIYGVETSVSLSTPEVTDLIYKHNLRELVSNLVEYLKLKKKVWLLFDNIDKGWATGGIENNDLLIIRGLIDATRDIERKLGRDNIEVSSIVFLRNDVYELLVQETSDRGKEASNRLDWTDKSLLQEMIRLRIVSNGLDRRMKFETAWRKICVPHVNGEESSQYLIDRSLMRPRFLLNLINQCKGYAINLNHDRIEESDIRKGLKSYSTDLIRDIEYEINDVFFGGKDILYAFISCDKRLSKEDIEILLLELEIEGNAVDEIINMLLWHGFLGVYEAHDNSHYIYDYLFDMRLMKAVIGKMGKNIKYSINPAFWDGLIIKDDDRQQKLI